MLLYTKAEEEKYNAEMVRKKEADKRTGGQPWQVMKCINIVSVILNGLFIATSGQVHYTNSTVWALAVLYAPFSLFFLLYSTALLIVVPLLLKLDTKVRQVIRNEIDSRKNK